MKKLVLLVMFLVLFGWAAESPAAPAKLTCDCSLAADGVTGAQLQFDNGTWIDIPVVQSCVGAIETVTCVAPSVTICYEALPSGPHSLKARFVNIWGSSADSPPFSFNKAIPSGYPTLRIK